MARNGRSRSVVPNLTGLGGLLLCLMSGLFWVPLALAVEVEPGPTDRLDTVLTRLKADVPIYRSTDGGFGRVDLLPPGVGQRSSIEVIELPAEGLPGNRERRHHAVRFNADSPGRLMRAMGLQASECSYRLRMPSRLQQSRGTVRAEVQMQAQMGCQY